MEKLFWMLLLLCFISLAKLQSIETSQETANNGDNITLKCTYPAQTNIAAEKYVWFLNNKKIDTSDDRHYKQHNSELLIKNFNALLVGYYKCQILIDGARMEISKKLITLNGDHGKNLDSSCLLHPTKLCRQKRNKINKEDNLKFAPKPTNKNFELGSSSKIHCKARGSGDLKIIWMRDINETLPNDVEDINGTLFFETVALKNKGQYTCYVSNGEETIHHTISIGIMPRFEKYPLEYLEVTETQQIVLDCVATGFPKPTWDFEGKIIKKEENESRLHIFENGSLVIDDVRVEDNGKYGCTVGNSAGFKRKESNVVIKTSPDEKIGGNAVLVTCLLSLVYIVLVIALMFWCRQRKKNRNSEEMENKNEDNTTNDDLEESNEKKPLNNSKPGDKVHHQNEKSSKIKKSLSAPLIIDNLMINFDKLSETIKLGCGQFGDVMCGSVMDFDLPNFKNKSNNEDDIQAQKKCPVLVKTLSRNADEAIFTEFKRQIDLANKVDCKHVVRLLALSLEKEHYHMILENSQDLKQYLTSKESSEFDLLNLCIQLVTGLESISKQKLTHRDIAIRNCIIAEGNILKLSMISLWDKDKYAKDYYRVKKNLMLPIRHMAPECVSTLDNIKYNPETDIYACGITIWEILTHGKITPFESLNNDEVYQKLHTKSIDYEMLLEHEDVSEKMRPLLKNCWSPEARPDAATLLGHLKNI